MSLNEQELVENYNTSPNSLLSLVVKVSVKQESITEINSNLIVLTNVGNGNYWIIYDADINYWLLPKAKLRIDRYRYETVKLLFDCDDYQIEYDSFKLDKPAQVSILDNQSEWKLEKRGVLKFNNNPKLPDTNQKESDNEQLAESVESVLSSQEKTFAYSAWLDIYNNSPQLLEKDAIKVLETTNSINKSRAGISQQIVLEVATKSNYWVVYDNKDNNCWLFFKNSMRISEYRYQSLKYLFDCYDYQSDYSSFVLLKPTKLISLATEDRKWIVEELGILKFIS